MARSTSPVRRRSRRARHLGIAGALWAAGAACAGDDAPVDARSRQEAVQSVTFEDAWQQALGLLRSAPDDPQVVRLFQRMWLEADRRGLVNVSRSRKQVIAALGTPDGRHTEGPVERLAYGFVAVEIRDGVVYGTIDLRGTDLAAVRPREEVRFRHDGRPWTVGARQTSRTQALVEYVLPGQTVQDWEELMSVQRVIGMVARGVELSPFISGMRSVFQEQAPEGRWRVISQQEDDVIYEFVVPEGAPRPAQHEVARVIRGEHDIHRVAYVRKGAAMLPADRDRWIRVLRRNMVKPVRGAAVPEPPVGTRAN